MFTTVARRTRRTRRGVALAVALAAFVLSVVPIPSSVSGGESTVPVLALAHVVGYAVLAATLWSATDRDGRLTWLDGVAVFLVTVAYGGLVEGVQATLPYRSATLADALGNAVGAGLAVVVATILERTTGSAGSAAD